MKVLLPLFAILVICYACTPVDVGFSGSYENLKYKFNNSESVSANKMVAPGEFFETSYSTGDVLSQDMKIHVNISASGFLPGDLFEIFSHHIYLRKGAKNFGITFKVKDNLVIQNNIDVVLTLTDPAKEIEFLPTTVSFTIVPKTSSPLPPDKISGSLKINNGASYTGASVVTLSLYSETASKIALFYGSSCDSNNSKGSDIDYQSIIREVPLVQTPLQLTNDMVYAISIKFKNSMGTESECITDYIKYHSDGPTEALADSLFSGVIALIAPNSMSGDSYSSYFDGAEDVYLSNFSIENKTELTISVWVKPDNSIPSLASLPFYNDHIGHIFWQGNGGNGFSGAGEREFHMSLGPSCLADGLNGTFEYYCDTMSLWNTNPGTNNFLSIYLGDGVNALKIAIPFDADKTIPQMITMTLRTTEAGSEINAYLDGAPARVYNGSVSSIASAIIQDYSSNKLQFGKSIDNVTFKRAFRGEIYKFLVQEKILSAMEIKNLCWEKKDNFDNSCASFVVPAP